MIIYFTAAVSLNNLYGENYRRIVSALESLGHKVIHEHITNTTLEEIEQSSDEDRIKYYGKVLHWISKADLVIAEVSFPSTLNVGHEVSLALEKSKPVIGLYTKNKKSAFFTGLKSERFVYQEYTLERLEGIILRDINSIIENINTRFNFYISPEISRYLDWIAKTKKLPRAVFLRTLLEKQMRLDKDFKN